MDYGNTATQGESPISPVPTEDEMSHVTDILRRAADAIVGMSKLQEEVATLRKSVEDMQSTMTRLRSQNDWLEESLSNARRDRDNAVAEATEAKRNAANFSSDLTQAKRDLDEKARYIETLTHDLNDTKRERDDYGLQVMELEEELKASKSKLAQITKLLGPSTPAMPTVDQVLTPYHNPIPEPPTNPPEPEPAKAERHVYPDWQEGRVWSAKDFGYIDDPNANINKAPF